MSETNDPVRRHLRELERAFGAFDKGERNRLYESRDAMSGLTEAVEASPWSDLSALCEIANRTLGILLMERGLDEQRTVGLVRELLAFLESRMTCAEEGVEPGGVFHVVNSQKVGELLLKKGLIGPDQLEKALLLQRVSKGRRVGQVLIAMNAIDQRTLDHVLEDQRGDTRREETRRVANTGQGEMPHSELRFTRPQLNQQPPPSGGPYDGSIPTRRPGDVG